MAREIYTVNAWIVDANGTKNTLSGYPKDFDSKNYSNDVKKAFRRAQGDLSEVWGAFCKRDDRMIQTVTLSQSDGLVLDCRSDGKFEEVEE